VPVGVRGPSLARTTFVETLRRLREERDFDAFPESRRTASLDLVEAFIRSHRVEVRCSGAVPPRQDPACSSSGTTATPGRRGRGARHVRKP